MCQRIQNWKYSQGHWYFSQRQPQHPLQVFCQLCFVAAPVAAGKVLNGHCEHRIVFSANWKTALSKSVIMTLFHSYTSGKKVCVMFTRYKNITIKKEPCQSLVADKVTPVGSSFTLDTQLGDGWLGRGDWGLNICILLFGQQEPPKLIFKRTKNCCSDKKIFKLTLTSVKSSSSQVFAS